MLQRLELKNFQSHKHSVLEFHPNVNVIIGESDSGKSAILRAIYWVVFGKPSGESMRRWDVAADTFVSIEVDNHVVTRVRGDKNNLYRVNKQEYKGFGQNVPPQVSETLNMESINFSRQMDMPFLFSMSPGELAQYLNKLVDLEVIGTTLTNISRKAKQHQKQVDVYQSSIDAYKTQLKELQWVDDAQSLVVTLNKKQKALLKKEQQHEEIASALDRWDDAVSQLKEYNSVLSMERSLDKIQAKYTALQKQYSTQKQLTMALSRYNHAKKALAHIQPIIQADKAIKALSKSSAQQEERKQEYTAIADTLSNIFKIKEKQNEVACALKQMQVQYKQQMPDICPLCGNRTGKEK